MWGCPRFRMPSGDSCPPGGFLSNILANMVWIQADSL